MKRSGKKAKKLSLDEIEDLSAYEASGEKMEDITDNTVEKDCITEGDIDEKNIIEKVVLF